jgi:hypothetical protein
LTVAFVSQQLTMIVVNKSLWKHVHIHLSERPELIAEVLARFAKTKWLVTLWSGGVQWTEKIRTPIETNIDLEDIHTQLVEETVLGNWIPAKVST